MLMSKDDITEMYRGAKNKIKQISILADMNCCSKKEIRTYLRDECGYEVFEPKGRASKKSTDCNKHSNLIGITEKEIRSYVFKMLSSNFQDDIPSEYIDGFESGANSVIEFFSKRGLILEKGGGVDE